MKRLFLLTCVLFSCFAELVMATDRITSNDFCISIGGTKTFVIQLSNEVTNYVGFQMDLTLPEGLTLNKAGCSLSYRITDENQKLTIGKQADNVYRLTSTSLSLTPISDTSGDLITVSVTASDTYQGGNATISNIQFATSNSERVTMNDVTMDIYCGIISFADENVKALCVANWDTSGDGELERAEADAVTSLGSVFLSNSDITSFDELQYFTGLTSIFQYAFFDCSGLTSIVIPNSVTSIGNGAFCNCSGLTSITIPESVASIGGGAFRGCTGLISVQVESGNTKYDSRDNCNAIIETESNTLIAGCNNSIIPDGVTSIGQWAFEGCSGLTSITIPESVTSIGVQAFDGCSGLTSVTIGNNVTSIADFVFRGCSSLTSIEIPSSVTSIGQWAFAFCSNLNSITIPESVTTIGNYAFCNCSSIAYITFLEGVLTIGEYAFDGCSGLTSITIPESVTSILKNAFYGCSGLTSITVENGNTIYDSRNNCNAIIEKATNTLIVGCQNTVIPNSVTSIGERAFASCSGLTSITIPEGVTTIGEYAFEACDRLTSVVVNNNLPFEIFETTFTIPYNIKLYVPKDSKTAYAAADYWKEFKTIKEYPDPDVNQDGYVDVLDVVDVARFVVGTPSESFDPFLADLNSSGDVNIADAVVLVNEIAGDVNWAKSLHASDFSDGILTLTKNADQSLSFSLEDSREYTAFQFDLMVPEGTDVEKMMLNTLRQQQHQLLYNKLENGHYRVAALSTVNDIFNGNDGELLNIAVSGTGSNEVSISDIHFIDVRGNDYKFADITPSEVTGIANFTPALSEGNMDVYDLQGRKMNASSLTKGIYIIGKKKVMIKY